MDLALLINRVALGAYFVLAGVAKIRGGVREFYQQGFLSLKPAWLPDAFASPYGHALPFLEVIVGVLLVVGFLGRLAAGATFLMLVSFTIALWTAGKFFGGPGPFHANIILIAIAFLLLVAGPGRASLDGLRR